jgi:hypothetical protein
MIDGRWLIKSFDQSQMVSKWPFFWSDGNE